MLTPITRCGTRSNDASRLCRRVCSTHAVAGVDEHDREVGAGHTGDHVSRVLDVPRAVGDHEVAMRRREVAVRDVDRDALLALGAQTVGEQREVDVVVAAALAHRRDVLELVLEDRLRVVQEAADQCRLAVVDAADRGEVQRMGRAHGGVARRHHVSTVPIRATERQRGAATAACVAGERIRNSPAACGLPCRLRRSGRRRGWRRAR